MLNSKVKILSGITAVIITIFICSIYHSSSSMDVSKTYSEENIIYYNKEPKLSRAGYINMKSFSMPAKGVFTSKFGVRWGKMHNGVDIGAPAGTNIIAACAGTVEFAGWEQGYGNVVKIDHGNGLKTVYGHCKSIYVKKGQKVTKDEKIGEVGSTGNSTGPHLHFEIRVNGTPEDPLNHIKQI